MYGVQTERDYRELTERHIVPLADRVHAATLKAWDGGDGEKAVQVLAEGAMAEPDNPTPSLLLPTLLIQDGRTEDAFSVLTALEQLSELHGRDSRYCGSLPRCALLVILDLLGQRDERTRRYRQILYDH